MQVTDLQGQSWPAAWKRAVFAVGFACLVCTCGAGFVIPLSGTGGSHPGNLG